MIELSAQAAGAHEAWKVAIDLARRRPVGWTLVGAQMVALHGLEHGSVMPRLTVDVNVVVDVRLVAGAVRELSSELIDAGFKLSDPDPFGVSHRFRRGSASIDVLAPDGVGERADLTTVKPCRTIQCPGGSQALQRSEPIAVRLGEDQAEIPRPNLLGAILVKSRAVSVSDRPDDQRRDLAFLLTLLDEPRQASADLRAGERSWLRRQRALLDPGHPAWSGLVSAEDGRLTLEILLRRDR